jgi:hypothetical protein
MARLADAARSDQPPTTVSMSPSLAYTIAQRPALPRPPFAKHGSSGRRIEPATDTPNQIADMSLVSYRPG